MVRPVVCILALLPGAFAGFRESVSSSTSTWEKCTTNYGSKSVHHPVPTTSKRVTEVPETIFFEYFSTPCTTVTPTSTITSTSTTTVTTTTTASTITDTFSTTSTETDTTIDTVTNTYTETDTAATVTTTNTASTTVPTPDGFEDIWTSTGKQTYIAPPGGRLLKRIDDASRSIYRRVTKVTESLTQRLGLTQVQCVTCNTYVRKIITYKIIITEPKKTHTAKPIYKHTSTVTTVTTTSTVVPPDCSTTSSFSTTTTTETTVTVSTTSTSTVTPTAAVTTTSTYYAACGTSNVLGPAFTQTGGDGTVESLIGENPANGEGYTASIVYDIDNGYDCCVACLLDSTCENSFLEPSSFTAGASQCYLLSSFSGECNNPGNQGVAIVYGSINDYGFVASNGLCGITISESE